MWTEEKLLLMFRSRNKRMRFEAGKPDKRDTVLSPESKTNMSADDFLKATKARRTVIQ